MERYTDSQYDDDLTIGADDYNDSFQTGDVDLFEFGGEEETTISRLKTLVLSIDWEITDEVLLQFNEEILDLKDVWADEKIQMVYLQALEKIGKYIYREKADAHPNAIRLLLSMYYNLERIVLSGELSDAEKKKILLEDVQRFDKLKKLINREPKAAAEPPPAPMTLETADGDADALRDLKAIVLGIDWEITDTDLLALREEVMRLREVYADSKPKQVFLQGIGTLGTYIRKKKSNAHADAFKLLHSFYEGLELLVRSRSLTLEQETQILKPEVKKFNDFKAVIADTLSRDVEEDSYEGEEEALAGTSGPIAPAFADLPEDGVHGFQEEEEAKSLQLETPINVDEHISRFFGDDEEDDAAAKTATEAASIVESIEKEVEEFSDAFFGNIVAEEPPASFDVDRAVALQGVDVETEADDDSDEEALPVIKGEVAPALVDPDVLEIGEPLEEPAVVAAPVETELADEVSDRLDTFFSQDEEAEAAAEEAPAFEVPAEIALQGVAVETPEDEEDEQGPELVFDEAPAGIEPVAEVAPVASWFEEDEITPALTDADLSGESALAAMADDAGTAMAEEDVEQRFDELFAALPDEESAIPLPEDAEVEEEVEAFFSLEEEPDATLVAEAESGEDVFDQEILGVREEEPAVFALDAEAFSEEEIAAAGEPGIEEELPFVAAEAEAIEELVEEVVAEETVPLAELRDCVQSLGIELRDDILEELFSQIDNLKERWADRPLELTFLQLLLTVGKHVDQYRFGASDETGPVLAMVMDSLEKAVGGEAGQSQSLLLAATSKVLGWQQGMLEHQSIRGADGYLQLVDGARVEPQLKEEEFTFTAEEQLEPEAADVPELKLDDREIHFEAEDESGDVAERKITDIVRREIESLRETLKKEIAELRRRIES